MPATYTPPEVARFLRTDVHKVHAWIARNELTAINIAERAGGRPRWRIRQTDLEAFLLRRQSRPPTPSVRRRRRADPAVITYF
jgi:excisionase family DNA binding protein